MEASLPKNLFIRRLAEKHRVVLLGGMAVIAHGHTRHTKDFDIWLEPMVDVATWVESLAAVIIEFPTTSLWSLAQQRIITVSEIVDEITSFGVVRVTGFRFPVDVFRKPNELELSDFDGVWARAQIMEDGVALPHEIDLYVTKANTGREHDWLDQMFLQSRVKERMESRIPVCDLIEAKALFDRFSDPEVLGFARTNPHADVRAYARDLLREFEVEGDPFSRDILAAWKEPA